MLAENSSVSFVRFSSRKRSDVATGKNGRQIWLKPGPTHFPGKSASAPNGLIAGPGGT